VRRRLLQVVDAVCSVRTRGSRMRKIRSARGERRGTEEHGTQTWVTVRSLFEWMKQKAMGSTPSDEMSGSSTRRSARPRATVHSDEMSGQFQAFATISKMVVKNCSRRVRPGQASRKPRVSRSDSLAAEEGRLVESEAGAPKDENAGS